MSKDIANVMDKWGFQAPLIGDETHVGIEKIMDFLVHVDAVFQRLEAASVCAERLDPDACDALLVDALSLHINRKPRYPS